MGSATVASEFPASEPCASDVRAVFHRYVVSTSAWSRIELCHILALGMGTLVPTRFTGAVVGCTHDGLPTAVVERRKYVDDSIGYLFVDICCTGLCQPEISLRSKAEDVVGRLAGGN